MSIRFISSLTTGLVSLPVLALALALSTGVVQAQSAAPAAPAVTMADAAPAPFRSALEGYMPYTEDKTLPWKEANDSVGRIGGWREYAREARQPQAPGAVVSGEPRPAQARP